MKKTYAEQLASARRELELRKRVYPRWVASNKMKPDKAKHEIECMEAIVETLQGLLTKQMELWV